MKPTILFVDDDAALLHALQRMLRPLREEYEMEFIAEPAKAVEAIQSRCFDIVFSDMRMPKIDGAALLAEVRKFCPHSVRVVLSGQAEFATVLRALPHAHQYYTKPCDAEILHSVMRTALNVRDSVKNQPLREFISQLIALPARSDIAQTIQTMLQTDNPSLSVIAELAMQDVAIAARILQCVNSSFFTEQRTISIPQAIEILGVEILRSLFLDLNLFIPAPLTESHSAFLRGLSLHSIEIGSECRIRAAELGFDREVQEESYLSGFLHDVGLLVFETFSQNGLRRLLPLYNSIPSLLGEEQRAFGANHSSAGGLVLQLWGFPESIVHAVTHHHDGKLSEEILNAHPCTRVLREVIGARPEEALVSHPEQ